MIPLLLAEADANSGWAVVNALSTLIALALAATAFVRQASGKGGERQIEPTQIAAIRNELSAQTLTLGKLDREVGEIKTSVGGVDDKISTQATQVENAFKRINAISTESAATKSRLEDHLNDHRDNRRHA